MWGDFFALVGCFVYLFGIAGCFARAVIVTSAAYDAWEMVRGWLWALLGVAMICFPIALAMNS